MRVAYAVFSIGVTKRRSSKKGIGDTRAAVWAGIEVSVQEAKRKALADFRTQQPMVEWEDDDTYAAEILDYVADFFVSHAKPEGDDRAGVRRAYIVGIVGIPIGVDPSDEAFLLKSFVEPVAEISAHDAKAQVVAQKKVQEPRFDWRISRTAAIEIDDELALDLAQFAVPE